MRNFRIASRIAHMPRAVPQPAEPTTGRPHAAVRRKLLKWFANRKNHLKPNRYAARILAVDEGTVRKYRKAAGIPPLPPGQPKRKGRRHG